ncbi:MAG: Uma2 family endonuclease [Spirochaetales bacterium]|nr:Uma2 family endonuclease [Spirochaetales bacterium]
MGDAALDPDKKYSYADYLKWPEEESWELIKGVPWSMSPAPASKHQLISGDIFGYIWQHLKNKPCQVYPAPFDVRLQKEENEDQDIHTVVQPDISVICDPSKIDKRGCVGAPDLVVEILSPSTSFKDQTQKLELYEEYAVKEYWIVNPERPAIQIFIHDGSKYNKPDYYTAGEILTSTVLPGLEIPVNDLY